MLWQLAIKSRSNAYFCINNILILGRISLKIKCKITSLTIIKKFLGQFSIQTIENKVLVLIEHILGN
jgi:hypothetical protein